MNIGLVGYGRMGREVEAAAIARGHAIVFRIDQGTGDPLTGETLKQADVAIEFTRPDAVCDNLAACFRAGVPVVTGTTGWHSRLGEIEILCKELNGSLFHASNFSIGVNLLFELNEQLARIMADHPEYRIRIEEVHHTRKLDAPSGTAITLADGITAVRRNLRGWSSDLLPADDIIGITSIREGNVTGIHEVVYVSDTDRITIGHEAFNRKGFAAGAVSAAEFLQGKIGVFSMKDLIRQTRS